MEEGSRMAEAVKVNDQRDEREEGAGSGPKRLLEAVGGPFVRFREFLHEVRVEMRNVTWPTMTDVRATTVVVIITVIFFGIFLFIVDKISGVVVQQILQRFKS